MLIVFDIGAPGPSKTKTGWNWFSSLFYWTRLPLEQHEESWSWSASRCCTVQDCLWDSKEHKESWSLFAPCFSMERNCLWDSEGNTEVLLLAVREAVSSHTKVRSRSNVQSILSFAPRCPRSSLIPDKSEEHQFCGALLTERTACAGWFLKTSKKRFYCQK